MTDFRINWRTLMLVGPAATFTVLFFLVPLAAMAAASFTAAGAFSFDNYRHFLTQPSYVQALVNSLEVTLVVTGISVVVAYPLAWVLAERVPERWQRAALMLTILPFWTSYVVRSYSWLLLLAERGVVNRALMATGLLDQPLQLANTRTATVMARSARESAPAGVKRNIWLLPRPRTVIAAASLGSPEAGVNEPMPPRAARLTWASGLNEPVTALLTVGAMTRPAAMQVAASSGARSARGSTERRKPCAFAFLLPLPLMFLPASCLWSLRITLCIMRSMWPVKRR